MQKSRQVDVAQQHKLASNLSLSVTMGMGERAMALELRHGLSGELSHLFRLPESAWRAAPASSRNAADQNPFGSSTHTVAEMRRPDLCCAIGAQAEPATEGVINRAIVLAEGTFWSM
jgi:hypothetical protein